MKSNLLQTLSFCLVLPVVLGGCQLLVDNRSEGTTPVVVVTTEEWDKKVRDVHSYDLKPDLDMVQKNVETGFSSQEKTAALNQKKIAEDIEKTRTVILGGFTSQGDAAEVSQKKITENIDKTRTMILEQSKLHEQASAEQLSQATKTSSTQAAELMEKLEKLTIEASEQLTALKELTKKNHRETADARDDLYRQVQTDIAMALAEIKGDAENLYKPFVVKPIDGSETVKFVSETAARLAGCSFKGSIGIQHKGSFDDALILLRNETYALNAKYLVPIKFTKIRPNGVGETMLNINVKMMDCPSKT